MSELLLYAAPPLLMVALLALWNLPDWVLKWIAVLREIRRSPDDPTA